MNDEFFISYLDESFFGGANYFKIWFDKKNNKYIIDKLHSTVPNYIKENKDNFLKKSPISKVRWEGLSYMFGHTETKYVNEIADNIKNIIDKMNFEKISRKNYSNEDLDGVNWQVYIEYKNKQILKDGYEEYPKELTEILKIIEEV